MRRSTHLSLAFAALVLATSGAASAESLEQIFTAANAAYFEGKLDAAVEGYQQLVSAGVHDPDVYFNLAIAEGRTGHLGRAVLYLERSLWLRPGDDAAEAELTAVQASLGKRRAEREGEATVQTRPPLSKAIVAPLSENALCWTLLSLDALLFGLLFVRRRAPTDAARLGLAVAAALATLLLLTDAVALVVKAELLEPGHGAVVLTEGAALREGPSDVAEVRHHALEGQLARVLEDEAGYVRVRLSGGAAGWMKQSDLEAIRAD